MISLKIEGVYSAKGKVAIRALMPGQDEKHFPDNRQVVVSDEYYIVRLPDDLEFKIEKCQIWQSGTILISLKYGDESESVAMLIRDHIKEYIDQYVRILSKSDIRDNLLDELVN
jgi:virulence-associated protein VagC